MANDRNRYDRDRYRGTGDRERDDDGYIARRGFGNDRSGFERGQDERSDERHGRQRERDFGDSAGYGSGGSALDRRDVAGDDRSRDDRARSVFGDGRGQDRGYSGSGGEQDRFGSSAFGRGSRDDGEGGFFERAGDEVRSWFGDDHHRRDRDARQGEHHRGRGPKGYRRSDERILEDVNDRLTDDPHIDASEIQVSVSNREVTLDGAVNSRFEKRHAEDLAESVSGVGHVQNNLRVQQYADEGTGAAGAGSTTSPGTGGPSRRRTSRPSGA
jgi:osmotically-inducible protein OsmY